MPTDYKRWNRSVNTHMYKPSLSPSTSPHPHLVTEGFCVKNHLLVSEFIAFALFFKHFYRILFILVINSRF